jgi:hypothetical protein
MKIRSLLLVLISGSNYECSTRPRFSEKKGVLGITRYKKAALSRDISEQQVQRNQCELLVKAAHSETLERYGIDCLHAHLSDQEHTISSYMVRSIRKGL